MRLTRKPGQEKDRPFKAKATAYVIFASIVSAIAGCLFGYDGKVLRRASSCEARPDAHGIPMEGGTRHVFLVKVAGL